MLFAATSISKAFFATASKTFALVFCSTIAQKHPLLVKGLAGWLDCIVGKPRRDVRKSLNMVGASSNVGEIMPQLPG